MAVLFLPIFFNFLTVFAEGKQFFKNTAFGCSFFADFFQFLTISPKANSFLNFLTATGRHYISAVCQIFELENRNGKERGGRLHLGQGDVRTCKIAVVGGAEIGTKTITGTKTERKRNGNRNETVERQGRERSSGGGAAAAKRKKRTKRLYVCGLEGCGLCNQQDLQITKILKIIIRDNLANLVENRGSKI